LQSELVFLSASCALMPSGARKRAGANEKSDGAPLADAPIEWSREDGSRDPGRRSSARCCRCSLRKNARSQRRG